MRVQYGEHMSQIIINSELSANLPEVENRLAQLVVEESPCPVCGKVCPNDSYCINCGYVYDPLLKRYQTHEQIEAEKEKHKKYKNTDARYRGTSNKSTLGKQFNYRALMVKTGKEYKRQHGRAAETGDIVRRKNLDGSYNKGSIWYIKTAHGWRRSPSKKRKPTKSQIKRVCQDSKKGR